MDDAAIAGIVVGAIVLLGAIAAVLFMRHKRRATFKSDNQFDLPTHTLSRGDRHSYMPSPQEGSAHNHSTFVPWLLKASTRHSNDSMSLDQSIASTTEPATEPLPEPRDSFWDRLSPKSREYIRSESSLHRGSSAQRLYQSSSIPMIEVRLKRSESYDTASDASGFETMRSFVSSAIIDKDDQDVPARPSSPNSSRGST
ncbi:hypothetical protein ACHHYP_09998 [Achlya hypogyna]|uniref:Uncharacterized protein n=1 Tax=Achlya hypogyna TaxID=1202772 RepID=A0A1V9YM14_ACHHY|nr:hypothetical protein ACHHYP_09998 [Achlya hypogyna]